MGKPAARKSAAASKAVKKPATKRFDWILEQFGEGVIADYTQMTESEAITTATGQDVRQDGSKYTLSKIVPVAELSCPKVVPQPCTIKRL